VERQIWLDTTLIIAKKKPKDRDPQAVLYNYVNNN